MAGDWIKMRTDLRDDPAVISVAAAIGVEEDLVVGKLHRLWSWVDRHTTDGNAHGVTENWIDRYLGVAGFAHELVNVGWLDVFQDRIVIPHFDRHNGQSSKRRALTAKRVAHFKVTRGALPREEKRREEKKKKEEDSSEPLRAAAEPSPCLVEFPTNGPRKTWGMHADFAETLKAAYPALDVAAEAKRALAWCVANPAKRKTPRGMPAFLNRWMERAQNSAGRNSNGQQPQKEIQFDDYPDALRRR